MTTNPWGMLPPRMTRDRFSDLVRIDVGRKLAGLERYEDQFTVFPPDHYYAPGEQAQLILIRGRNAVHVVGSGALADEIRTQLTTGAIPGYTLHPTPAGHTELRDVAPLFKAGDPHGTDRTYNVLSKQQFSTFEEIAATPAEHLRSIRNLGERALATIRKVAIQLYGEDYPGADVLHPTTSRPAADGPTHITLDASKRAALAGLARHQHYAVTVAADGVITMTPTPPRAELDTAGAASLRAPSTS
ncbi:DNA-directed RNA polymerase subunit alpha C-terminal domain-containing protein [Tsukamurella hominis]|uniref:DNA-directed RNA polymerase subunit alpha C-terminal domain-containing protein n=1 Tax=Tsukamurella hominis TaxID=1970232 RepID=UPI0039E92FA4